MFDGPGDNWEAGEMSNVTTRKFCGRDEILYDVFYDDTHGDLKLPHVSVLPLTHDVDVGAENFNAPILPIPIPNPFTPCVYQAKLDN